MASAADMCVLALQQHQAGNLGQAEQLYRLALAADPNHADCHHLLGVLAFQAGQYDQAVMTIRHALALNPWAVGFHSNLGVALSALGQVDEALQSFYQALSIQPDHVETLINLANLLQRLGRLGEAVAHCQEAARLRPESAEVRNNLASAMEAQGRLEEAATHFRQALQLGPAIPEIHNNLGNVLQKQGKLAEAAEQFRQSLQLRAENPDAHNNLANALYAMGRTEEALPHWRQALSFRPDFPEAHSNLAVALHSLGQMEDALAHYREATRLNPGFAVAYCNQGNVLRDMLRFDDAIASFQQAVLCKPDLAEAHINLGTVLLKTGRADRGMVHFQQALAVAPNQIVAQSNRLFCMNHDPDATPEALFEEHLLWGQLHEMSADDPSRVPAPAAGPELAKRGSTKHHFNVSDPERRLRIGYVSPDLRKHALMRYLEPVLAHHDPKLVEIHCYADVARPDAVSARYQSLVQGWRLTSRLNEQELAECIRADGIDILVDLAGHTGGNRLRVFALKPAPIQATWLGYLNTTGLTSVDYRLTDDILDPPGQPRRDTEELLRLRCGFCCFGPPEDAPEPGPLPALQRQYLTFGSLHSLFKVNDKVLDLWSKVLQALPSSRLLMFRETLTGTALEELRERFAKRGIDAARLDLRQGTDAPGYLRVCQEIDVGLDAFPWTGGVTTCESLWMGVPVLSLCGVRPASRNSAAMLARVGLSDWAVQSDDEFVRKATRVASDLDQLAQLRASLRERMAPTLCDARGFTRVLEDAYRTMWRKWCADSAK